MYVSPPVWMGPPPAGIHVSVGPGELPPFPDLLALEEIVVDRRAGPLRVTVAKDGFVAMDFERYAPAVHSEDFDAMAAIVLRRLTVLNAFLGCLATAAIDLQNLGLRLRPVGPDDVFSMSALDKSTGFSMSLPSGYPGYLHDARTPSSYNHYSPAVMDRRLSHRTTLEQAVVDSAVTLLDTLLEHRSPKVLSLAELYVRSAAAYSGHDHSNALVQAWAIIEAIISELWEGYVAAHRSITTDSGEVFVGNPRLTAAAMIDVLAMAGELPAETYGTLGDVRRGRNKWMHELLPVEPAVAQKAVEVAGTLFAHVHGITLKSTLGRQLSL